MYLYLLEITYPVHECARVETWLSQAQLGGVIISIEQYTDEILAVLASEQSLKEEVCQQVRLHSAISSCEGKRRAVYRVTTKTTSEHVLCSFPFRAGEEWYLGSENSAYLCVQSPQLSDKQLAWLATNAAIAEWRSRFDLVPVLTASVYQGEVDDLVSCKRPVGSKEQGQ